ncbi:MAG: hypothetical protein Q7T54_04035 [Candidatus Levybacteria bacterium]|nr:hypothetical protein [Candidatus Levybacteria bacterium]
MDTKNSKKNSFLIKAILTILIAWLGLSFIRTVNNFSKILTEETSWIGMNTYEKKSKLFGADYVFFDSLKNQLASSSNIVIFSKDAKPYLLGRYILYPIKIYHAKSLNEVKSVILNKNASLLILYNVSNESRAEVLRYLKKPIRVIDQFVSVIRL